MKRKEAQSAEQRIDNPEIAGTSPAERTIISIDSLAVIVYNTNTILDRSTEQ